MSNATVQALGNTFVDKVRQAPTTDAAQLASDFEAFSAGLEAGSQGPFAEFVSAQLGQNKETAWMAALITQTSKTAGAPQLDKALLEIGLLNNALYDDEKSRGTHVIFERDGKLVPPAQVKAAIEANDALNLRVMNWEKHGKAVNFGIAIGFLEPSVFAGVAVKSARTAYSLPAQGPEAFVKAWDMIKAQVS